MDITEKGNFHEVEVLAIAIKTLGGRKKEPVEFGFDIGPFSGIEAIIDIQAIDLTFDEAGLFEFLKVLRNRGAAQRQFVGDVARNAGLALGKELDDGHPRRVRQELRIQRDFL